MTELEQRPHQLTGRALFSVLSGLLLVLFVSALDSTIVATALPTIASDLGGLDHIAWVTTAYLLAQTVVTPLYGRLGDIHGRRRMLQIGLAIFLIGSTLCGISQSFGELVAFRGVQGLGGGGLVVSAQAAIGDVVSPRERGRYQGLFGAVFGFAVVIGPLLGGYLTSSLSWRWIFYINLPIGAVAFVVLGATFPHIRPAEHRGIDYLGTAFLALGLAALVLMVTLGGTNYAWDSPFIIGLGVTSLASLIAFVAAEHHAREPVMPLSLFRNSVFVSSSVVSLLLGLGIFGALTFLPLYFQVVRGESPTRSGLELIPLLFALLVSSTASGQIITRTGKYRVFPIAGTAIMTVGLFMLSRIGPNTSTLQTTLAMLVTGFGIGLVMQVLVVAVQNAVNYEDLGVATSGVTLFRNIGSSVGVAVIGSVFANALSSRLSSAFPGGTAPSTTSVPKTLPPVVRSTYLDAYAGALDRAFLVTAFVGAAAFAVSWTIKQLPMRETVTTQQLGEAFAAPKPDDSLSEIARALGVLIGRPRTRAVLDRLAVDSSVDLPAAQCWVLVRVMRDPDIDIDELGHECDVPAQVLASALADLAARGLVEVVHPYGQARQFRVSSEGNVIAVRLVTTARIRLDALLAGWSPDRYPDLARFLTQLAAEVVPEPKRAHQRATTAA